MPRSARLARLVLWPLFVAASTAGFAFGFGRGELVTTLALVPIAQWLYLAAAEALWPADGRGPSWRDPEAGRDVFHAIVGQGVGNQLTACLAAINVALLDAIARGFGVRVCDLIGGCGTTRIPAYASTGFFSNDPDRQLDHMLAEAAAHPYAGAKIKIGHGIKDDVARVGT